LGGGGEGVFSSTTLDTTCSCAREDRWRYYFYIIHKILDGEVPSNKFQSVTMIKL
jgi:hypothetical protein